MSLKTPILYIVFNRLQTVEQTFPRIAAQKPEVLFVAADGPRVERKGENDSCAAVRDYIISHIDWPGDVHTLFRDENLGCKYAVSGAIQWFFSNVEDGIVLEDDILPEPSFFSYCERMLSLYRDDPLVAAVCSFNREGMSALADDIFLCTVFGVWGWASWANKVKGYSPDEVFCSRKKRMTCLLNRRAELELLSNARRAVQGELNTWDYQFSSYIALNGMYSLVPRKSLVQNLGFDTCSTHTSNCPSWYKAESWDWGLEILDWGFG